MDTNSKGRDESTGEQLSGYNRDAAADVTSYSREAQRLGYTLYLDSDQSITITYGSRYVGHFAPGKDLRTPLILTNAGRESVAVDGLDAGILIINGGMSAMRTAQGDRS